MTCNRCGRRERAVGLAVCEGCANSLVARTPTPEPEWVRRAREAKLPVKIRWAA